MKSKRRSSGLVCAILIASASASAHGQTTQPTVKPRVLFKKPQLVMTYSDFSGCKDQRLRTLRSYDSCSQATIAKFCGSVATLRPLDKTTCAREALRVWSSCTTRRLSPAQSAACAKAKSAGIKIAGGNRNSLLSAAGPGRGFVGSSTSASLPWVTIASDFFVSRAKSELVLYLRDRIVGTLCKDPKKAVVSALLPETCSALQATTKTSSDLLMGLPGAFRNDLAALPSRLPKLMLKLARAELMKHPQLKQLVCIGETLAAGYKPLRDLGPLQALDAVAKTTPSNACKTDVAKLQAGARTLHEFVQKALEVIDRARNAPFDINGLFAAFRDQLPSGSAAKLDWLKKRLVLVQRLVGLIRKLDGATKNDPDLIDKIVEASVDVFVSVSEHAGPKIEKDLRAFGAAVAAFATRRYSAGILRLLAVPRLDKWARDNASFKQIWKAFGRYGPVVAALAAAKNAEDARKVLESAAAPLGSWREFRRDGVAAFVSAYLGFAGGAERMFGDGKHGSVVMPVLPIGFELGFPLGKTCSFNIMLSVVDLGAVAAARLDDAATGSSEAANGTAQTTPETDFASFFAPGAFASIGLGNSPFVLGAGVQYLPANRRIFDCPTGSCDSSTLEPAVRAFAFLAIDLPVFPLLQ